MSFLSNVGQWISRLALMAFPLPLWAGGAADDYVRTQLVSVSKSIQPGRPVWVAIRFRIEKGWHIYWRNPGDSGMPIRIRWHLPDGFEAGEIQWPCPQKIVVPGMVNYGYEDEVFLLTRIEVAPTVKVGTVAQFVADVDWLVCKEVCLPASAKLRLELPVKKDLPKPNRYWKRRFEEVRQQLPIEPVDWKIAAASDTTGFLLRITPPEWFKGELNHVQFFPEESGVIDHSATQTISQRAGNYEIRLKRSPFAAEFPKILKGILYRKSGWRKDGTGLALAIEVPVK